MTSTLITVFNLTTIVWQASFVVYKLTESETRNQHFTVSYVKEHLCGCTLMWQQIQVFYICNISKTKQTAQARIQGRWNGWIFTPLFLSPLLSFFFSYPSNIEMIFDFSDWGGEISPPISKSWIRAWLLWKIQGIILKFWITFKQNIEHLLERHL